MTFASLITAFKTWNWRAALEVTERLVMILAAALALFPIWQWYAERED